MARRLAKFLVLGWNVLWGVLVIVWLMNPALEWGKFSGGAATTGPQDYPPTKPPDWLLFQYWFAGLAFLVIIWAATEWWARRAHQRRVTLPHAD